MTKRSKNNVRIGLVQMSCAADPEANLKKALSRVKVAAAKGARIVCLQELFNTPYFCQTQSTGNFDLAQRIPGPATDALARLARSEKVVIVAPLFENAGRGVYYNAAAVINADGKLIGKYRKMHIPDDPGFNEKFYFTPGDLGFQIFDTAYARIGVLICWDQWFPEAARLTALAGAKILFYPTAIGWKPEEPAATKSYHSAWETVQRGHAIANGVYVAAANRVGKEGPIRFWGNSFVADPFGGIGYRASATQEEVILADCDLSRVDQTRREWPFFRDRRIDSYSGLSSRILSKKS
ncbi:MAG: carbon-nitrogen hydrolase [Candidatus Omnitrophota bacterium]